MDKLKVMTIVGTRPEIINLSQVMKELDKYVDAPSNGLSKALQKDTISFAVHDQSIKPFMCVDNLGQ